MASCCVTPLSIPGIQAHFSSLTHCNEPSLESLRIKCALGKCLSQMSLFYEATCQQQPGECPQAPAGRKGSGLRLLRMSSPIQAEACPFLHESQASSQITTQMLSPWGLLPRIALHKGLSRRSGSTMRKHREPGSHGVFVGHRAGLAPSTTLQAH